MYNSFPHFHLPLFPTPCRYLRSRPPPLFALTYYSVAVTIYDLRSSPLTPAPPPSPSTRLPMSCSFPDGLEDITFGTHFNQTIAAVKWPPGLLRVTFGDRFNKPVASAAWPASLTHLTFGRGFDQPLQGPRLTAPPSGGDAPGWPPAGLVSVIVGSKFTGDAVPVEEGGVGGGKSERRMGETGFPIFRRFSPKRSKRRGSGRGIGGGRSGSTKVGQDKGDGGASTLVASSESASTPTEKRAGGRFSSLKR